MVAIRAAVPDPYRSAVERYAGTVRIPVGIAGPVCVAGHHAEGDYRIPFATSEGALVASYHRGCLALNEAGGCRSLVVDEAMTRTPCFRFANVLGSHAFVRWAESRMETLQHHVSRTSNHCRLRALSGLVEGNHAFLRLEFATGEATGQNMVTVATDAICSYLRQTFEPEPEAVYVEANLSGDKKASTAALSAVRGARVVAEARLSAAVTRGRFGCTPDEVADQWYASAVGGSLSGSVGLQGHYANALAAIYIALGQDAACVAESAIGITRMTACHGELYASVTLPNVIVGTVGGGTGLPDQAGFLDLLELPEARPSLALAEVIGAVCLAGELSIAASIASGSFARAHRVLGRRRFRHG